MDTFVYLVYDKYSGDTEYITLDLNKALVVCDQLQEKFGLAVYLGIAEHPLDKSLREG